MSSTGDELDDLETESFLKQEYESNRTPNVARSIWRKRYLWILSMFVMSVQIFTIYWLSSWIPASPPEYPAPGIGEDVNGIVPRCERTLRHPLEDTKLKYSPVSKVKAKFDYSTEKWVPGPHDSNVTADIWDNWSSLLPGRPQI